MTTERSYTIKAQSVSKKIVCTTDLEGKIVSIPMPDVQGELPNLTIEATSPIEAIRKYWCGLQVEPRPAKLTVGKHTYIVDWASWNKCGGGQTGWWVLRSEEEYEKLRDDKGNAAFELPRYRLLQTL